MEMRHDPPARNGYHGKQGGERFRIILKCPVAPDKAMKRLGMGLTKGVEVHIRKVAPLGDPLEVTVRGYELSLRKADANMIEIE